MSVHIGSKEDGDDTSEQYRSVQQISSYKNSHQHKIENNTAINETTTAEE